MTDSERDGLIFRAMRVFSPGAPIEKRDLFSGRLKQLQQVMGAINTRGQHVILFGERGVGKTSLATILKEIVSAGDVLAVKVNCDQQDDTFVKVWKKALSEIELEQEIEGMGFMPGKKIEIFNLAELLTDSAGPDNVRRILQRLNKVRDLVVIFDEFDKFKDPKAQQLFADTIKNLSDNSIKSTLVVVGVADNVDGLIKEHASIDRALVQIQMPRMKTEELEEIIEKALKQLGMNMRPEGMDLIILISQGLPHYTHLLGQQSTIAAIKVGRKTVRDEDVQNGIVAAIENSQQSIKSDYENATVSPRKDTLFRQVLLACALAKVDDSGYFSASGVREPLSRIMGETYDIPWFSQHLDKFSSDDRGEVLEKTGRPRRFRFRFRNPLLQPYVIMRGLENHTLAGELISLLQAKARR